MPDFDIDFCKSRRDEVIEYVQKKYGFQNVAQIITFGSMISRGILKDIGRVEGVPYSEVERMVNKIPYNPVHPLSISELKANHTDQLGDLADSPMMDKAESMEGALRNVSTHAAGIIISSDKLYGNIPLFKDDDSEIMATQFNMKDCEKAGLLKFDFLGLANLTIIDETLKLIKKINNVSIDLTEIPFDDEKTFKLLSKGYTCGVFQVESAAMVDTLIKLKPTNLEEIIAVLALNRPGPMQFIDSFIKRKKGEEEIIYDHPLLEPILKETYGIIVYQEQIMKIAQVISGYTLGQADLLRRAIGKKIKSELMSQKDNFIKGAVNKKIRAKDAEKLFGYQNSELIGKKRVSIFSPGEIVIQNVLGWLEEANKHGKSIVKTNFVRKDGSYFNAEIIITPNFADGKDKPQTGYCGITKEIKEDVNIPISLTTKIIKGIAITRGGFTLASILPMVIVSLILSQTNSLSLTNAVLSIIGIICAHIFVNLFNDYFDVKSGTDENNNEYFNVGDKSLMLRGAQISGGSRAVELGLITLKKTKILGNLMIIIALEYVEFVHKKIFAVNVKEIIHPVH